MQSTVGQNMPCLYWSSRAMEQACLDVIGSVLLALMSLEFTRFTSTLCSASSKNTLNFLVKGWEYAGAHQCQLKWTQLWRPSFSKLAQFHLSCVQRWMRPWTSY
uniref:Uncharacterized protein n=1 Tax=Anguilla anguilla TaxID=7936 RepID=A0A0E9WMM3_ANGAN